MTVDPYSGEPVYLQIAAALRAQIAAGEIPPGSFLPSLRTISERYEVARMTAERAVAVLRNAGLVRGVPGRGVYVIPEGERGQLRITFSTAGCSQLPEQGLGTASTA